MGIKTDFLFAMPSFFGGAATVFSLGGFRPSYNQSATPGEADAKAIRSDWAVAGEDILLATANLTAAEFPDDEQ